MAKIQKFSECANDFGLCSLYNVCFLYFLKTGPVSCSE